MAGRLLHSDNLSHLSMFWLPEMAKKLYLKHWQTIRPSLFLTNKKLTENPFPARHLVDVPSYHYKIDGVDALSMIAQLGCPFECGFCGGRASPFLRKVRTRTSENIIAEMRYMYDTY